jgi:hypothetical protein
MTTRRPAAAKYARLMLEPALPFGVVDTTATPSACPAPVLELILVDAPAHEPTLDVELRLV